MSSVIFSGSYVKALKAGLNLFNNATIWSGNIDPSSSGFTANIGDVYISTSTAIMYIKEGTGSTAWSAVSTVGGSWKVPVANAAALPGSGNNNGDVRAVLDTNIIYEWNGSAWQVVAGPADILSVGLIDSVTASANGAADSNNQLIMQSASATVPGLVNNTTQTFSGNKTFTGTISASNLSGTNTGDVTLTAVGSSPSANGASLSGQALTLQPADGTHPGLVTTGSQTIAGVKTFLSSPNISTLTASELVATDSSKNLVSQATGNLTDAGTDGITVTGGTGAVIGTGTSISQHAADTTHNGYLSSTDWNTFNGKQASGNYITALTGDVTATGPGSVAATVAKIQGTTVSGTTGSTNVVFSSGPTLSNPVVGTQATSDNSTKAASTAYVTTAIANAVAGINPAVAVQAATAGSNLGYTFINLGGIGDTLTGSNNTALTIDGFTFTTLGQRLLVKDQSTSYQNGVYYVTQVQAIGLPVILTRALDFDTPSDINNTGAIPVINGTVNGTTQWVVSSTVNTVDVDPITFTKFARNPADYLLVANNLSDVNSKSTSFNNLSPMTTSGDIIYGGASGTGTRLGANSTGTNKYLQSVSSGTPSWAQVAFSDLSGQATTSQLPTLTSAHLFVGNGSNVPTDVAVGGDVSLANTGSFTVTGLQANPVNSITPTTGYILTWDGSQWSPISGIAPIVGPLLTLWPTQTNIISGPTVPTSVETFLVNPTVTGPTSNSIVVNNNTLLIDVHTYNTALGITSIPSGAWQFNMYASTSAITNTPQLICNVCKVVAGAGTVTVTGSGTTRTVTATSSMFVSGDFNATLTSTSYVQVPGGIFPVASFTSGTVVTITTPSGYVNDGAGSAYTVYRVLFNDTITLTSTASILYLASSAQAAFTINSTDKIATMFYGKSTGSGNRTITYFQDGSAANSSIGTPITGIPGLGAGVVRATAAGVLSSAELTGDVTTSGSNATTAAATQNNITSIPNLVTVGTIGTGTWAGTTIAVNHGGTGQTSLTAHDVLVGNGTSGITQVAPTSTTGIPLVSNGTSSDPSFTTASVSGGGTGQTTLTNHGVLVGAGTSAITQLAAAAAGTVLTGQGASSDPSFSATPTLGVNGTTTGQLLLATSAASGASITVQNRAGTTAYNMNLPNSAGSSGQPLLSGGGGTSDMTYGTLGVAAGGTGQTTLTNHGVLVGAGTSAITQLAAATAGTVLTGQGASSDPSFSATPTLGVNGTTTGQLLLATSTASGASITLQNRSTTSAWNFNLPTTAGSANQVLTSQGGGTNNMTWTTVSGAAVVPTVQTFTSTGTQTGWLFSVTSWTGTIVSGDTYTNNGHTYTAQQVSQTNGGSGFTLFMSGTSATTTTGTDTLTRSSSASGPATITFDGTKNIATATYTTPASVLYLEIKLVGGGGGGAGGNASTSTGNNGTSTYFGPNILNGLFGSGASSGTGGTGGTASVGAALGQAVSGGNGQGSFVRSGTSLGSDGGMGASTPFAGGGAGGANSGNGANGPTNSGAGGGGGGGVANSAYAGAGGGAGGYVNAIITSPAATYPYVVGSGGSGGSTTTNGGNGAAGYIIIVEKYQ